MTSTTRRWAVLAAVVALWLLGVFVVLPSLIADAYAGRSPIGLLNQAIRGQADHSVVFYQQSATRLVIIVTLLFVAALLTGLLLWPRRNRITAFTSAQLRASPTVTTRDVLLLGTWFGLLSGVAEVSALLVRFVVVPDPREAPSLHSLWLGPLAGAVMGLLLAILVALTTRAWRGVSVILPVVLFSSFTVFSTLAGLRLGIHRYALFALCAGIAVTLGRRAKANRTLFVNAGRRSLPWLIGASMAGGVAMIGVQRWREQSGLPAAGADSTNAPNVLLLILDTVRAEELSAYGYSRRTTPTIDSISSTGATFVRAIAPAPWTLPSHASMFTGVSVDSLSADFDVPLDNASVTLAEVLRERGYATGGFVANLVYAAKPAGLAQGFATYRSHPLGLGLLINSSFWSRKLVTVAREKLGIHGSLVSKSAADVNQEFLDWLPNTGAPFFAFLNYFDAHVPYHVEAPFDRQFRATVPRSWLLEESARIQSAAERQELRDAYDSAIAYIDAQIGVMLKELDRRGVLKNTIVIVTSDHGEQFGEHNGIMSHGNSLYLQLLNVPLVISYPGHVPAGARVESPVALQDLAATIIDMTGTTRRLPGVSLARFWEFPNATTTNTGATAVAGQVVASDDVAVSGIDGEFTSMIYSDLTYNTFSHRDDPIHNGAMQSIVSDSLHYIRNGDGSEELYDLIDDPDELHDIDSSAGMTARLQEFRRFLDARSSAPYRTRAKASPPPNQ